MLDMNKLDGPIRAEHITDFTVRAIDYEGDEYHAMLMVRWRNGNTGAVNVRSRRLQHIRTDLKSRIVSRCRNGDWHRTHQGLEPLYRDVWAPCNQ
jgi:hypothetical protein